MRFTLLFLLTFSLYAIDVNLAWNDTKNPITTTYNVYRATGLCSGSPIFSKIATGVTTKTYTDANISSGNYCYHVTANLNNLESAPSNTTLATVLPYPPANVSATIKDTP